ncbi:hypothetical protein [Baaleninema simplex]|uniref:hypothetical protein n=1 Tax=Baaleninema simplex TaxID=2862350 RepID=UPI00036906C2|nr:hypothetical protein [Baaleninema simplex]
MTISTPASSKSEQKVRRKSWGLNGCNPASRDRFCKIHSTAWGVKTGYLEANPARSVKSVPAPDALYERLLDESEVKRWMAAAKPGRDRAIVLGGTMVIAAIIAIAGVPLCLVGCRVGL